MLENYQSPWMDEELSIMRDAVRKFIEREFAPRASTWDKQGFVDRDAWLKAGEAGLLCASIPEQWGGGGGNFKHEMILLEELNSANVTGFGNAANLVRKFLDPGFVLTFDANNENGFTGLTFVLCDQPGNISLPRDQT